MKTLRVLVLVLFALALVAPAVLAQTSEDFTKAERLDLEKAKAAPRSTPFSGASLGAGLGAALAIVGAGLGFGRIGAAALESMARQPEVAGRIQTAMIVIAALLEGVTLFALIVCIIVAGKATF